MIILSWDGRPDKWRQVLKGEATCEEMPYETINEYGLYVSYAALAEMGLTLPEDYAARAIDANA